ncbi:hypothetical protein L3Q82_014810 [Scortum barcoo]|uniref:Uncharacterized protein n=1 Tax=Scortum barcoo TaxID=214431 RepID=A0ACB8VRQ4_9TELE|nr:hypothetical protein L3Q82_014810 [Scortum barcoo]
MGSKIFPEIKRKMQLNGNRFLSLSLSLQIGLMSVTVFPVRLLLVSFLMLLAWPFAFTASLGRSEFVIEPQCWWRRFIDLCLRAIMRAMWFCGGFHWIKVKGERAAPSEAPILTVAPHSSYFDAIPVTMTMCSIVTKLESRSIPVWGNFPLVIVLCDFSLVLAHIQNVPLHRRPPSSDQLHQARVCVSVGPGLQKKNCGGDQAESPIERGVASDHDIPRGDVHQQVRSHLIQGWYVFSPPPALGTTKPGGRQDVLINQVPSYQDSSAVQPVVLRYPNKLDTVTWTWQGPGAQSQTLLSSRFKILWFTLCQPHNPMEIEYLPVYTPSNEEKENPSLFASNVRKLMAKALEVPLTDLSFDDREISLSQGPLCIYDYSSLLEFNLLVCRLGLRAGMSNKVLEEQARRARKLQGDRLGLEDFAQFLSLPVTDTLTQVHSLFDQHGDGQIDIRHYVIALSTIHRPSKSMETLRLAFKMYESEETGEVLDEELAAILEVMLGVTDVELSGLFVSLDRPDTAKITYDELHHFIQRHPYFVQDYLDFKNHSHKFCVGRPESCNGQSHDKHD